LIVSYFNFSFVKDKSTVIVMTLVDNRISGEIHIGYRLLNGNQARKVDPTSLFVEHVSNEATVNEEKYIA
jgi:hypothetical protein